jgi:hypothetical protein
MKKVFLFFFAFLFFDQAYSQITLTSSDIGSVGDQVIDEEIGWEGPAPMAGSNQNFNFQGQAGLSFSDTTFFLNPANTPFASDFTTSNIAQGGAGAFSYFTKSASGFKLDGFAFSIPPIPGIPFSSAPFKLTPSISVLNFPSTMGQNFTGQATSNRFEFNYDTTLGVFNITKIGVTATLRDTSNIDGFGTADFPGQSIPVLRNLRRQRISFRIQVFASISIFPPAWIDLPANLIPGGGLPDVYTRDILFWSNGKKAPVATFNLDTSGNVASCRFQADLLVSNRHLVSARPAFEFTPYPNPNPGILSWKAEKNISILEIFSVSGKKIKSISVNGFENLIKLDDLENGSYLIKVRDKDGNASQKKLIISK